jgi:type IV secretion system protein VirB10
VNNHPPRQPGSSHGFYDRGDAGPRPEVGVVEAPDNPYVRHQGTFAPDLDANAPELKSTDLQRLNRKALLLLAGIVGLLLCMATWMFSARADEEPAAKPREEKVVIPELPDESNALPSANDAEPIAVKPYAPAADLPALPIENSPPPSRTYAPSNFEAPPPAHELSLRERRMGKVGTSFEGATTQENYAQAMLAGMAGAAPGARAGQEAPESISSAASARYINQPDALLVRGTYVRCVLETRIVTDIPGFTSCTVTEPVYSINGRSLLLPKGSKISGRYDSEPNGPRVSVIWDRITTPNGIDVNMASPGVDDLGGAGHPGEYNAHWGSRISAALLISVLSDAFKYAAAENGPPLTSVSNGVITQQPYESSTARTMERMANQALDRSMHRPATVTINQGTVVNVYVAKDVDFSGVLARR